MKKSTLKITLLVFGITLLASNIIFGQSERRERNEKPPSIEELFKKMDKNEDGKLSFKEIKGPLKDDFKKVDANEDGFITKKELEKAPKPKRREKKGRN